jgi:hypothetical protein
MDMCRQGGIKLAYSPPSSAGLAKTKLKQKQVYQILIIEIFLHVSNAKFVSKFAGCPTPRSWRHPCVHLPKRSVLMYTLCDVGTLLTNGPAATPPGYVYVTKKDAKDKAVSGFN